MSEPTSQIKQDFLPLIERVQASDDDAFEKLLFAFEPMIARQVSIFADGNPLLDAGDLKQEADLCFHNAVIKFDLSKGSASFPGYAKTCVHNGLVSYLRSKKQGATVIMGGDLSGESAGPDPIDLVIAHESYLELCKKVQDQLSDYESKIWWLHFAGRTPKEIAALVGKDEKSVTNAIYRIRQKLRKKIPNP